MSPYRLSGGGLERFAKTRGNHSVISFDISGVSSNFFSIHSFFSVITFVRMAKHKEDPDEESPHKKRRKLTKGLKAKQEPVSIQTSKDLQSLLAFDQNVGPRARQSKASPILFGRRGLIPV